MLLFPFINSNKEDIVECVLLPEIPIWNSDRAEEGALVNRHLLVVMLLLCGSRFISAVEPLKVVYPSNGTKKALIKERIQTVQENMMDLLNKANIKVKVMEKEITELRALLPSAKV